jgi:hypothetical protein
MILLKPEEKMMLAHIPESKYFCICCQNHALSLIKKGGITRIEVAQEILDGSRRKHGFDLVLTKSQWNRRIKSEFIGAGSIDLSDPYKTFFCTRKKWETPPRRPAPRAFMSTGVPDRDRSDLPDFMDLDIGT